MTSSFFSARLATLITARLSSARHVPAPCLTTLVRRDDLIAEIERQRHKRLLVVQASAGYGKTVLLSQWRDVVQNSGAVVVWVGLEKADGAPECFLASLVSGIASAGISFAERAPEKRGDANVTDLLADFLMLAEQSTRETWLILEDWHRIDGQPVDEMMSILLRNLPANWHVALTTRARPKLNLLMLRARGQLIELNQDELRFAAGETRMLMAPMQLHMGAVEELVGLTEGWPIALQLAHLWLCQDGSLEALRSSFIGSIDGMAEFLATEIFAALAPDLRDFLVESSICARFTGELVDHLRGQSDSAALIESLRSPYGLTVAVNEMRGWYRHHRLLAEFLSRERRRLSAERGAELHSRAALWFEGQGLLFEAVQHARLSGDQARTVQLVEDADCVDICIRTGAPAVRALLDSLPPDVVHQRPRLRAAYTAVNLKLGSIGQAGDLLAELQASTKTGCADAVLQRDLLIVESLRQCFIDESPSTEDIVLHRNSLKTFADADWWLKGLMRNVQGRFEMRRGLLHDAVRSLTEADEIFENGGSAQGHFFMLANLAICHLYLGRLARAREILDNAHRVLESQLSDASAYTGVVHTVEALILYERNELPAAGHAAHLALAGLELAEGCFEQYLSAIQVAARVAFATSGLDEANRVIDRGRKLARYHALTRMEGLLDRLQLRLMIDAEQWDAAAARLTDQASASPSQDSGWLEQDLSVPTLCLLALHEGRPEDAKVLANQMAMRCRDGGRVPAQVRAHILEALAAHRLANQSDVNDALHNAIELASKTGLLQPFFEIDGPMLTLLRDFKRTETTGLPPVQADFLSGLVLRLIAAGKAKAHTEHLTGRECQILELLRHGGSNKVIARALDLSENAVKFHLKNIFRKLNVDNRAMAAQVAHRLDLREAR